MIFSPNSGAFPYLVRENPYNRKKVAFLLFFATFFSMLGMSIV